MPSYLRGKSYAELSSAMSLYGAGNLLRDLTDRCLVSIGEFDVGCLVEELSAGTPLGLCEKECEMAAGDGEGVGEHRTLGRYDSKIVVRDLKLGLGHWFTRIQPR